MSEWSGFTWLLACFDLTNSNRKDGPMWKTLKMKGETVDVLHMPSGAVYRFTVTTIRPPATEDTDELPGLVRR